LSIPADAGCSIARLIAARSSSVVPSNHAAYVSNIVRTLDQPRRNHASARRELCAQNLQRSRAQSDFTILIRLGSCEEPARLIVAISFTMESMRGRDNQFRVLDREGINLGAIFGCDSESREPEQASNSAVTLRT